MLPGEIGITARVHLQYRNRSAIYGYDYGNGWTRGDKKAGGLTLEYFFVFSYSSEPCLDTGSTLNTDAIGEWKAFHTIFASRPITLRT